VARPGFSGAELANLINEAALLRRAPQQEVDRHARASKKRRDKVRWGRERRSLAMSEKEKENTAYHEAGHALVARGAAQHRAAAQGHHHPARPIARAPPCGCRRKTSSTAIASSSCSTIWSSPWVDAWPRRSSLADVTNGAMGDIRQATSLSRKMVCAWGMSEKMGMVEYGDEESAVFLARDISRSAQLQRAHRADDR